ncbi:MAG TPA: TRAP transporter substrate-binding protein [Allosphingosinicella sp.]|nr:TRAP transporter substrate-binding protein [Allosphingosinicella sp.]
MRRREFLLLAAAAAVGACERRAPTANSVRIGHADNIRHSKHLAFVRAQEQLHRGGFEVSIFPGGQLGSERELIEQTQRGVIQITSISNGTLVPFVQRFALLDIPFQFTSYAQARSILDGDQGSQLLRSLEAAGLIGLGFWIQGFRHLTTRSRLVRDLPDLRGLKIRTMQAPLHVLAFQAMGAIPVPMAWSEVYPALEQGVIDGQENPLAVIYDEQLFRVQRHVTLTGHILDPMPVVANKAWLDGLPAERRQAVQSAFSAAMSYQWQLAEQAETQYLARLRSETRMSIIELDDSARERFRTAAQPRVLQRVREELGDRVVSSWMTAMR